jgi:hypothetical protein
MRQFHRWRFVETGHVLKSKLTSFLMLGDFCCSCGYWVLFRGGVVVIHDTLDGNRCVKLIFSAFTEKRQNCVFMRAHAREAGDDLLQCLVAEHVIREWITFYNTDRTHTALDKRTPDEAYFNGKEMMKAA